MTRQQLAQKLAQETRQSKAAAQDQVDELVRKILGALREGHEVPLAGVGKLIAIPAKRRGSNEAD